VIVEVHFFFHLCLFHNSRRTLRCRLDSLPLQRCWGCFFFFFFLFFFFFFFSFLFFFFFFLDGQEGSDCLRCFFFYPTRTSLIPFRVLRTSSKAIRPYRSGRSDSNAFPPFLLLFYPLCLPSDLLVVSAKRASNHFLFILQHLRIMCEFRKDSVRDASPLTFCRLSLVSSPAFRTLPRLVYGTHPFSPTLQG